MQYDFVNTYSGKEMSLVNPKVEDVSLLDISYTLANIKRWNATTPFTVAQHSLLVEEIVRLNGGSNKERLLALLHDSAEAYIGDMPKPLKDLDVNSLFLKTEALIEDVIRQAFQLEEFNSMFTDRIRQADALSAKLEAYKYKTSSKNFNTELTPEETQKYKDLLSYIHIENHIDVANKFQLKVKELLSKIKKDVSA